MEEVVDVVRSSLTQKLLTAVYSILRHILANAVASRLCHIDHEH